jgi:hypothetical protein
MISGLARTSRTLPAAALLLGATLSGCSHGPVKGDADPKPLLEQACSPGAGVRSAKGSVWLKAKSNEASGQFPAVVDAPSPERLKMEVTNLVGGTEAILTVEGRRYTIEVPKQKNRTERGEHSWAGIPLQWANALFLGRVPCPESAARKDATLSIGGDGELVVQTKASLDRLPEKYVYRFRSLDAGVWPESLHWERQGIAGSSPVVVDLKFDEPEPKTRSPRKWEAKSAQGEVKVRWRDRQIDLAATR